MLLCIMLQSVVCRPADLKHVFLHLSIGLTQIVCKGAAICIMFKNVHFADSPEHVAVPEHAQ